MAQQKKHIGQHRLDVDGDIYTFEVFTSHRRTMTLRVRPDGSVTVDAPTRIAIEQVYAFVRSRAVWIRTHQAQVFARAAANPPRTYMTGEVWHYLGRAYTLRVETGTPPGVAMLSGEIVVRAPSANRVPALLRAWYKGQAISIFADSLRSLAPKVAALGITPPDRFTIREMSSKWGSCSSKGRVTLNLKLVQLPLELIDYVIAHELCHLRELNHSPRYYALLEAVIPDWKEKRRLLHTFPITF